MPKRLTFFRAPRSRLGLAIPTARGFTMVELLVVIVIIVILFSAVLVAGTTLISKAKISSTRAVLTVVRDAVEQFKRDQEASPTITRAKQGSVKYIDRYGYYPPDELEVFSPQGLPGSGAGGKSLAPGGAKIVPTPQNNVTYGSMRFYTRGLAPDEAAIEHRDLAAMIVAIEVSGRTAGAILDRIDERYRVLGPLDNSGDPMLFLDRPAAGGQLNESWNTGDFQIRYIVDDWGNPISYMAQRDWNGGDPPEGSSNHDAWNEASTELIRLNGGQPIIMSYGPDGTEQLTAEVMGDNGAASLVGDLEDGDHKIGHHLNADNVYVDPALKARLEEGIN